MTGLILLGTAPPSAVAAEPPPLALPQADVGVLPATAQRQVEALEQQLVAGLAARGAGDADDRTLAGGFALLGQLYHAYELVAAAEQAFDSALVLAPGDADLLHRRGLARGDAGSFAAAAADFQAVVAARPQTTAVWIHLGEALLATGRPAEAREAFRTAEAQGARAAAAHGLGRAALAAGEPARAVEHLQSAISLQPSATVAHLDLATAFERLGDRQRAARHRSRAGDGTFQVRDPVVEENRRIRSMVSFEAIREMAVAPSDEFDAERFLDFVVAELATTPGASDRLRAALATTEQRQELARLHLGLGGLLLAEGRRADAIVELTTALELAPGLPPGRLQLAGALAEEGRFEEALGQYDRLLAARPGDALARTRRGAIRGRLGRHADARRDLDRAVATGGEPGLVASANTLLAGLELVEGRYDAAAERYRLALAADPENRDALRGLGMLLGRLERFGEAAEVLARLVALEPRNAGTRDAEVVALIFAGDEAAARRRLDEALSELPDDPRLAGRLARLLAAASARKLRDGERAVELALAVFAVEPTEESVETLAMAYAEAGDYEQAIVWQRRLLASGDPSAPDRGRWQRHLELYESGRSCCGDPTPTTPDPTTPTQRPEASR